MKRSNLRLRPVLETVEARIVCASVVFGSTSTGSDNFAPLPAVIPGRFPSADRFRAFTQGDLENYTRSYLSFSGEANFNPAYDFNGTGFIGQNDATPILRGLASITPHERLTVHLKLANGQLRTAHPSDNGAVTRLSTVTVVGKTTPNSVIFVDALVANRYGFAGNLKFQGGAVASDAQGNFDITTPLTPLSKNSLSTLTLLVKDPFGATTLRAFPIVRLYSLPRSK